MAALASKKPGHHVGAIAQLFGGFLDAFFSCGSDVARQRGVIQNDGYSGRRKSALRSDIAHRYGLASASRPLRQEDTSVALSSRDTHPRSNGQSLGESLLRRCFEREWLA